MTQPRYDEQFMALALSEARKGLGRTFPNPSVGCVIVLDGKVVGQGYHHKAGEPHAEVMALRSVDASVDLSKCTLYVTLEPCCMTGKTPACTSAIERAGIRRVVVGAVDPDARVNGKGVALLKTLGVEVVVGVLQQECEFIIRGFAKRTVHKIPWVLAKWAMTLDGKIATKTGESMWITGEKARFRAHQIRNYVDAIMVGKNTAIEDDPRLTCRIDDGHDPIRVLVDARLEVPLERKILHADTSRADTIVLAASSYMEANPDAVLAREAQGVRVLAVKSDEETGHLDMDDALHVLGAQGIGMLMVEGGGAIFGSLQDAQLIDEVHTFIAPKVIGGQQARGPVLGAGASHMKDVFALEQVQCEVLTGGDVYISGQVPSMARRYVTSL